MVFLIIIFFRFFSFSQFLILGDFEGEIAALQAEREELKSKIDYEREKQSKVLSELLVENESLELKLEKVKTISFFIIQNNICQLIETKTKTKTKTEKERDRTFRKTPKCYFLY